MGQVKSRMWIPENEGKDAAREGLDRESNPYNLETQMIERSHWFIGYDLVTDADKGVHVDA